MSLLIIKKLYFLYILNLLCVFMLIVLGCDNSNEDKKSESNNFNNNHTMDEVQSSVSMNKGTLNLEVGATETLTLIITTTISYNNTIIWTSADDSFASISEDGVVTAISAGIVLITGRTADNKFSADCSVTVTERETCDGLPNCVIYQGKARTYMINVPNCYTSDSPAPLLFDFHGHGSNSFEQSYFSGMRELSNEKCFIALWPQGLNNSWNAESCCPPSSVTDVDDEGFVIALIDKISNEYTIDRKQVYASGISNGGGMSHLLGVKQSDVFAAVAPFALPLALLHGTDFVATSVIVFQASDDEVIPISGYNGVSGEDSFNAWKNANGCIGNPVELLTESVDVDCRVYTDCTNDVETAYCVVPGDHVIYDNVPGVSLTSIAWDFMSRFSLD